MTPDKIIDFGSRYACTQVSSKDIDALLDIQSQAVEVFEDMKLKESEEFTVVMTKSIEKVNDEFILTVQYWSTFALN